MFDAPKQNHLSFFSCHFLNRLITVNRSPAHKSRDLRGIAQDLEAVNNAKRRYRAIIPVR